MKVGAPALHRLPAWPLQQPTIPPFLFCSSLSVKSRTRASAPASASELRNADGSDTVIGFQCNERYLEWDGAAGRQLIRIHCARQLGTDVEHVNAKLEELAALLPDLVSKLENLKADLVLTLVRDTEAVARRMLTLREALPGMNVSGMVAGNLWLLQKPSKESLQRNLQAMRDALPGMALEPLLENEPRLLLVDIAHVLGELERLLPGTDPRTILATHAGMVLGMKDAGLPASLEIDDGIKAD